LGFDFIVDEQLNPWLVEINFNPNLRDIPFNRNMLDEALKGSEEPLPEFTGLISFSRVEGGLC
jgi:hypothetical protein